MSEREKRSEREVKNEGRKKPENEKKQKNSLSSNSSFSSSPFEGTGDRVRCAAVCREWSVILSAPCYWRELQLDTADFDGRLRRQQRRRELQRRVAAAAATARSNNASSSSAPPANNNSTSALLRRHHHLDRAPADAGARAAFADALLRLAERAGGALERVRVVSARASDVGVARSGGGGRGGGVFGGPRRDGGGAFALLDDDEQEEEDEIEEEEEEEEEPYVEDERGAGTSRRGAPPRLFYGDGVSLEPFPGARVGFCGAGRELEAWLSATAIKLSALSVRTSRRGGGRENGRNGNEESDSDSDDSLIAAVGVFGAGDADALARIELARAEAAAYRERVGASARLQAALCGKPFGGKYRFSNGGSGGAAGGGRRSGLGIGIGARHQRRRSGGSSGSRGRLLHNDDHLDLDDDDSQVESLASWALRAAAYLCFRALRGALRAVLRWRRGRSAFSRDGSYSRRSYSRAGGGLGSAAVDGALTLAAVMLAARLLVAAFALPALAVAAARGLLSVVAVVGGPEEVK